MSNINLWARAALRLKAGSAPVVPSYSFSRTLNRTFSGHPTWGGGNVSDPANFVHNGDSWRLYQVIPFSGPAIGGVLGDCRIHLRDRSIGRGQNTLESFPTRLEISKGADDTADWTGLPWTFTRTTSQSRFMNAGSGGQARKQVGYVADRPSPGASPAAVGIAQGESFTVTLFFDQ